MGLNINQEVVFSIEDIDITVLDDCFFSYLRFITNCDTYFID